ncbi:hypothetical protein EG327_009804 [Venturia inaequalis]|uniref:alpha-galactosidase n=1 Tax=Venturia inaequalis TaxID=5025 RepID=A0A8H3VPK2_VENIN|nr:hypothetical protein EG327_009804 [Venturia inaequalis]
MVRYALVAGLYAATVLAVPAPVPGQEARETPAGWIDGNPTFGFGWPRPNSNKPGSAANVPEAGPSSLFVPAAGTREWGSLFKGSSGGSRGEKGGSSSSPAPPGREWGSAFGGSRGGADSNTPPKQPPGSGMFGGLFGGGNWPRPPSSGSSPFGAPSPFGSPSGASAFGWGRPQSQKPKPEWKPSEDAWPKEEDVAKPEVPQPKPEAAAQPPKPDAEEAAKPEPAQPAPETAKPEPAQAAPEVAKPEPAQSDPEVAKPEPKPVPEVTKPEPKPEPKPVPEVTKPEPKPESKPAPEIAKPEPKPAPETSKEESKPEPKPEPKPAPETSKEESKPEPRPAPETAKQESKPEPKPEAAAAAEVAGGANSQQLDVCAPKKYNRVVDIDSVRRKLWQPAVGSKWQIILDGVPDTKGAMEPKEAAIWDIDAWDARASDICEAKKKGKKVICYFSAGTSETWRADNHLIAPYNIGNICADTEVAPGTTCKNFWKGEKWIDIRNPVAWEVMKGRIKMAAEKGCDGIDPDNMDIYDNEVLSTNATYGPLGKNVKFSENDSVKYLKFMADEAAKYGMSTGLKNSLSMVPKVKPFIQFAVNEECAKIQECHQYKELLAVRKPIFHIEYTGAQGGSSQATSRTYKDTAGLTKKYCNPLHEAVSRFSTIIKAGETLGNQYLYCDGKPAGFSKMAFYVDKDKNAKGGKGNYVEPQGKNEEMDVEVNERFANTTTADNANEDSTEDSADEDSTATTQNVKRRAPIKRRHHRWAELERNPAWTG